MTDKERHNILTTQLNKNGESFLQEKRLVNMLSDLGFFEGQIKTKQVFSSIIEEGYVVKLLEIKKGNKNNDEIFPQMIDNLCNVNCYPVKAVSYIIQQILYALDVISSCEEYDTVNDFNWLGKLLGNATVSDDWNTEYVIFKVEPKDATVWVDYIEYHLSSGELVVELPYGKHNYQVASQKYKSVLGSINVQEGKQETVDIKLKPSFGVLTIIANCEQADVYLDNKEVGKTPVKIEYMSSGVHTLEVKSAYYLPYKAEILIKEGDNITHKAELIPNFSDVVLRSNDPDVKISIDNNPEVDSRWVGKLTIGTHTILCKKESFVSKIITIEVVKDSTKSLQCFDIPDLEPLCGGLKVNVLPVGSKIYIDKKHIGNTPFRSKNILIGKHEVEVKRDGYIPLKETVNIKERNFTDITGELSDTFMNDLDKIVIGDYLYDDGTYSAEFTTRKKCLGIVFSLAPSETDIQAGWTHGYILSMKDDRIKNKTWKEAFDAVKQQVQPDRRIAGNWQIPTIEQWRIIFTSLLGFKENVWDKRFSSCHYRINMSRIEEIGEHKYWSSTQTSSLRAWIVAYIKNPKSITKQEMDKQLQASVRCIAAF